MRDLVIQTISQAMKKNEDIFFLTGDLGFGVLEELFLQYPSRVINAGVAEQNMTGLAAGLALTGLKVFTYSIGNFNTLRVFEQIRNDIAYHNLDVNILTVGGGFSYGRLGASHFALEDVGALRCIPELSIFAPGSLDHAKAATINMLSSSGPKYMRIDKSYGETTSNDLERIALHDIVLMSYGGVLAEAQKAAKILKEKFQIKAECVDFYKLKPVDEKLLDAILDSARLIVTIEEHISSGGLFSIVAERVAQKNKKNNIQIISFSVGERFPRIVGDQDYLRKLYNLDADSIVAKILEQNN